MRIKWKIIPNAERLIEAEEAKKSSQVNLDKAQRRRPIVNVTVAKVDKQREMNHLTGLFIYGEGRN